MKPSPLTVNDPNAPIGAIDSDGTIDRMRWDPTAEQLAAFTAREVQLCIIAIQRNNLLIQSNTLFAHPTWETARRQVDRQLQGHSTPT